MTDGLPFSTATLDDLPEAVRGFYRATATGRYELALRGVSGTENLRALADMTGAEKQAYIREHGLDAFTKRLREEREAAKARGKS